VVSTKGSRDVLSAVGHPVVAHQLGIVSCQWPTPNHPFHPSPHRIWHILVETVPLQQLVEYKVHIELLVLERSNARAREVEEASLTLVEWWLAVYVAKPGLVAAPYPPVPQVCFCVFVCFVFCVFVFLCLFCFCVCSTGESSRRNITTTTISQPTPQQPRKYVTEHDPNDQSTRGSAYAAKGFKNSHKFIIYKIYKQICSQIARSCQLEEGDK
jgi:hypothetical protein